MKDEHLVEYENLLNANGNQGRQQEGRSSASDKVQIDNIRLKEISHHDKLLSELNQLNDEASQNSSMRKRTYLRAPRV